MFKMEGYCPICDERKILLCNSETGIGRCPECGHHLALKTTEKVIVVGGEYIFSYRFEDGTETEKDKKLLVDCSGLNCKVLSFCEDSESKGHGKLVLVECCNGEVLNVYADELDELKESDIRYFNNEED